VDRPRPPIVAAAHVFVDDLHEPVLSDDDEHHLARVLRLRDGEIVTASDGRGAVRVCTWRSARLEPASDVERTSPPRPAITIGFALVKGERPEWIVQKLTECGVDRVVPFIAARSVVRWDDDKARRHVARWRQISREAAMQSRRAFLPEVAEVVSFDEALAVSGALADPGGAPPSLSQPGVLIGPEGGWSDSELSSAPARVALGPHVLRAETASVAAGVLLCALRSGVVAGTANREASAS
jgi:16S rRNA (uracil1498-N3)-methyltransferase